MVKKATELKRDKAEVLHHLQQSERHTQEARKLLNPEYSPEATSPECDPMEELGKEIEDLNLKHTNKTKLIFSEIENLLLKSIDLTNEYIQQSQNPRNRFLMRAMRRKLKQHLEEIN